MFYDIFILVGRQGSNEKPFSQQLNALRLVAFLMLVASPPALGSYEIDSAETNS